MSHRFFLWCSLYVVGICRYIYYFSVKFFHQLLFFSYYISLGVAVDEFFVVFMLGKYADSISELYVALSVFSQEIADDQKMWLLFWDITAESASYIFEVESVYFPKHKNIFFLKKKNFLSANHFVYIWSAWVVPIPSLLTYLWKFLHLS